MDLTLAEQALLDVLDGRAVWVPQDNYTEVMRTYNDRVPRV